MDVSYPPIWELHQGEGPLLATAIHDGHATRDEVTALFNLADHERLREEDPFTGVWTEVAPTRVIGLHSRFEVDLNRPRDKAVYREPGDAWGLNIWKQPLSDDLIQRSLAHYDAFYEAMRKLLEGIERGEGRFVVYDLHTYNHRRGGPGGPEADTDGNPQVNVGTGSLDRKLWGPVVDCLIDTLRAFDFPGGRLEVRENIKFQGGNWPRWIHENFPQSGVAIAIEFKKFFMDEWSGRPNRQLVKAIEEALRSTVSPVIGQLNQL